RRLDLRAETLERHHASNHFQRIALRRNCREPLVRIEKSELSHRPHIGESCCHASDSHKLTDGAIFRGALMCVEIVEDDVKFAVRKCGDDTVHEAEKFNASAPL